MWSPEAGTVSRSFDSWKKVEGDIRAFLALTMRWASRSYDELWAEASRDLDAIFDPNIHSGDEHLAFFEEKVNGLWPSDYFWMLRATVIREAVSAFVRGHVKVPTGGQFEVTTDGRFRSPLLLRAVR
ncbi:hypothetical protein AB0H88_52295, partial [Nonomuraea sp. NPDC050680]|uniref:hypothetical protein n=1 Tax=Nonomuraea sp. NPDC050680 TaxID=3154630 RepID=UPI0033CEA5E7